MKKILFYTGVLALAASCTQDDLTELSVQENQPRGITFVGSLVESPATRGDFVMEDDGWKFKWYAEKDRINIYGTHVTGTNGSNDQDSYDNTKMATYKATQSETTGKFTAVSDDDILDFENDTQESSFLALYPGKTTSADGAQLVKVTDEGKYIIKGLPKLKDQEQTAPGSAEKFVENMLMVSETTGMKVNSYDAVGEKINLDFMRQFPALTFTTLNVNKYTDDEIFGKLKSIEIEMLGYDGDGDGQADNEGNGDILPSNIDYGNSDGSKKLLYQYDPEGAETKLVTASTDDGESLDADFDAENVGAAANVKVKLGAGGAGCDWHDGDRAFMVVSTVDRSKYTGNKVEKFSVTYEFENITLSIPDIEKNNLKSSRSWTAGNVFGPFTLDINDFDYLVTNETSPGSSNDQALIVNKGNFADVFNEEGKVIWPAGSDQTVEVTKFSNIVSYVELTDEDLASLKEFTNLASITLNANTTIPAGTFVADQATTLKKIDFPNVTEVENGAFADDIELETVILPAYGFEDEDIAKQILKESSLKHLDMSGIAAMNVGFPSTGFSLYGYDQLEDVKVQDGVRLGANSFSGCTALETVDGIVDIQGTSVFNGCEALTEINIAGTEIKANTFKGCTALTDVLYNGEQVAPTKVDLSAFEGCGALVNMDLSQIEATSTVGDKAFKGCTALTGGVENGKTIIRVGGATIGESAFEGCDALVHVEFLHATSLGNNVLNVGSGATLKQVQLDDVVTFNYSRTYAATTFGHEDVRPKVDLFITLGQGGVDGNTLTLSSSVKVTFKSIRDRS